MKFDIYQRQSQIKNYLEPGTFKTQAMLESIASGKVSWQGIRCNHTGELMCHKRLSFSLTALAAAVLLESLTRIAAAQAMLPDQSGMLAPTFSESNISGIWRFIF